MMEVFAVKKALLLLILMFLLPSCAVAGTAGRPAARVGMELPEGAGAPLDTDKEKEIQAGLSLLRLPFIRNNGQIDDGRVRFYADTCVGTALVTDDGVTYATANGRAVKESFAGAKAARAAGMTASESKVNYFAGNDKNNWRSDIQTYDEIVYPRLYAGIDLTLKAYGGKVEKVFTVYPGANPAEIAVQVNGVDEIRVNDSGELEINTGDGVLKMTAPIAYQEAGGEKVPVEVAYDLRDGLYRFRLGRYDHSRPLVIDPLMVPCFSTYLGGVDNDRATAIAIDSSGNTYVAGYTLSNNFPTANPYQGSHRGNGDVFIAKLNPDSTGLVYSTYFGGNGWDQASAIAVDSSGNTYVTGYTLSANFPTVNPCQGSYSGSGDAFVAKLSPAGNSLVYSTYLGGSNTDNANAIAIDSAGNAYLTGYTHSNDFPTDGPYQASNSGFSDAFITKLNSTGNGLIYSTYLGGITEEKSFAIAVDSSDNTYVAGYTLSTNFPTANPYQVSTGGSYDAFITKLNPSGSGLVYSTYLGGNGFDQANAIAVESSGSVYVAGWTDSANFPVAGPCQASKDGGQDAFVTKLNPSGNGLVYSTYLGGSNDDRAYALAVDSSSSVYITGYTGSGNFPTAAPCQASNGGGQDAFAAKLNPPGSGLLYSTYLGGSSDDNAYTIAVDPSGNTYVAGFTLSANFPTINPCQTLNKGGQDAFVTKLIPASNNADLSSLAVSAGTLNPGFAPGTTLYTVHVANAVTSITLTPTVADATATVNVNGSATVSGGASAPISLGVGANTVTAVVYAQDGSSKTYTVIVNRTGSSNADLSGLALSSGGQAVDLSPAFSPSVTSYSASVANNVTGVNVTPTLSDSVHAMVYVNDSLTTSGNVSGTITLHPGSNTVTATVYAQDGTAKPYTITVNRLQDTTGPVVSGSDPANGAVDVPVNTTISISFSQNIQADINFDNVTIRKDGTAIGHTSTINGNALSIIPSVILDYNSAFTLTIPAGAVKNLSGNGLTADFSLNFTTISNLSRTTSSSSQVLSPLPNAVIKCGTIEIILPVIFDGSIGNARVNLSYSMLTYIYYNTQTDPNGIKTLEVSIPKIEGATSYTLGLEGKALASKTEGERIRISTCLGDVIVPSNMLNNAETENMITPGITFGQGDKTRLDKKVRQPIGDRPLIQLTLSINGKQTPWSNPNAPVTVSVSYKPAAEEYMNPEYITVRHIVGNGDVVAVPSGRYDPENGKVTFRTTHFSDYAVVYINKTFADMDNYIWAQKPVGVLASKGIINSASETTFSPAAGITRADYLLLLVKTLDLTAEFNDNFDDVKQGDYYYDAAGIAKKLGIATGSSKNMFYPNDIISRQDMMALTERALRIVKKISATGSVTYLDKFEDIPEISGYAVNSIATLVEEGLITGDRHMINPFGNATRAEAAVLLYRIYNK